MQLHFMEDNTATLRIIKTGKSDALKHVSRTHGVNIAWLNEVYRQGIIIPRYCVTDAMAADIFTKAFTDALKWRHATGLIQHSKRPKKVTASAAREGTRFTSDTISKRQSDRDWTLIEYCIESDSALAQAAEHDGAHIIRITQEVDATRHDVTEKLLDVIDGRTSLHASMPCTGGSSWQRVNRRKYGDDIVEKHIELFHRLWSQFSSLATQVVAQGGQISIEWPRGCAYWQYPKVNL